MFCFNWSNRVVTTNLSVIVSRVLWTNNAGTLGLVGLQFVLAQPLSLFRLNFITGVQNLFWLILILVLVDPIKPHSCETEIRQFFNETDRCTRNWCSLIYLMQTERNVFLLRSISWYSFPVVSVCKLLSLTYVYILTAN